MSISAHQRDAPGTVALVALLGAIDGVADAVDAAVSWTLSLLSVQPSFPPSIPRSGSGPGPFVLVTGTSTGIGRAIALRLAAMGYAVLAGVRRVEDGKRLEEEFSSLKGHAGIAVPGGSLRALIVDVAKADSLEACRGEVDRILADTGRKLYAVVANAGIPQFRPFESTPPADARGIFEVNYFGALETARTFLPHLRRHGPGARVIFVSSSAAMLPFPLMHAYAGSKCALEGAADALRAELALEGLAVVLMEPGVTPTAIWEKGRPDSNPPAPDPSTPITRLHHALAVASPPPPTAGFATADYVARRVAAALAARFPGARWPVGLDAWLFWVMRWLLPARIRDLIVYMALRAAQRRLGLN